MSMDVNLNGILLASLGESSVSTEGFLAGGLTQTFLETIRNFFKKLKDLVQNLFSPFKETELDAFLKDHRAVVDTFIRSPALSIPSLLLPIPAGMTGTYVDTVNALEKTLPAVDITLLLVQLSGITKAAETLLEKDDVESHHILQKASSAATAQFKKEVSDHDRILRNTFDTKRPLTTAPSQVLYPTKRVLSDSLNELLKLKVLYKDVLEKQSRLKALFDKCDTLVGRIIEHPDHFTRDDLIFLSSGMLTMARMIELKGVSLNLLQQCEHQFTVGLRLILGIKETKK